jgi:hypothetical protein
MEEVRATYIQNRQTDRKKEREKRLRREKRRKFFLRLRRTVGGYPEESGSLVLIPLGFGWLVGFYRAPSSTAARSSIPGVFSSSSFLPFSLS